MLENTESEWPGIPDSQKFTDAKEAAFRVLKDMEAKHPENQWMTTLPNALPEDIDDVNLDVFMILFTDFDAREWRVIIRILLKNILTRTSHQFGVVLQEVTTVLELDVYWTSALLLQLTQDHREAIAASLVTETTDALMRDFEDRSLFGQQEALDEFMSHAYESMKAGQVLHPVPAPKN